MQPNASMVDLLSSGWMQHWSGGDGLSKARMHQLASQFNLNLDKMHRQKPNRLQTKANCLSVSWYVPQNIISVDNMFMNISH